MPRTLFALLKDLAWMMLWRSPSSPASRAFNYGAAQSPVTAIASVALRVMRIFMCPPMRSGGFELLGRRELKHLTEWNDGQPGTELNFKFYRQATDTIVGISDEAAAFLSDFF
jgi:hypothetical protein